ncbi:MAG: plastocyanin/azurin family copper-binding protein [Thermoanaerobaculia bacterium]
MRYGSTALRTLLLLVPFLAASAATAQVNDCTWPTATDQLNEPGITITFANGNFSYAPRCVIIEQGTQVTFSADSGTFGNHPLVGGRVENGVEIPDPTSPIPHTTSGTTVSFTFDNAGIYPFYCDNHSVTFSMYGAIYVALFADGFESQDTCSWDLSTPLPCD